MAFHIRDPETDALVRRLALERGVGLTEAVKKAVESALETSRRENVLSVIRQIQAEIAAYPSTGLKADKAFFDSLSGDD